MNALFWVAIFLGGMTVLLAGLFVGISLSMGGDPFWRFRRPRVWLVDFQGDVRQSYVATNPARGDFAFIAPMWPDIGWVHLSEDGTCHTGSRAYFRKWYRFDPRKPQ